MTYRPLRSALYLPAANARALDKSRSLPVDALIFDLEDAVAPDEKPAARALLVGELQKGGYDPRLRMVRINALDTPWGHDDAAAVDPAATDAILLPKVNGPADLDALAALTALPIWAMMETPRGILNAAAIAAHPRLGGMVMGTNDLANDIGSRTTPHREPLMMALQTCVMAARTFGLPILDGVFNAFKDTAGLTDESEQGRDMGFDGKTLIHPAQIATANAAFAPTDADIALARRRIAAFEEATRMGKGIAVVDGRIVEGLHIVTAKATLARAAAIAETESSCS